MKRSPLAIEEAQTRMLGLSKNAQRWLHAICEQMADDHSWSDIPPAREECSAAGLVFLLRGGYLEVDETVQDLVYGQQFLADLIESGKPAGNTI